MKAIKVNHLPTRELVAGNSGEKLSIVSSVSDAFSLSKLLVHREVIPPNRKTAPIHTHSVKEELFIVEAGNPSIWLNGKVQKLSPGEAIGLKPDDGMRMVFNDTSEEAIVWTIGTNEQADAVKYLKNESKAG